MPRGAGAHKRRKLKKRREFTARTGYPSRNVQTLEKLYAQLGDHFRDLYGYSHEGGA